MENQIAAVTTLREFLLQKFPNLSLRNASGWIATGQREWTEDMELSIFPPSLGDEKLAPPTTSSLNQRDTKSVPGSATHILFDGTNFPAWWFGIPSRTITGM